MQRNEKALSASPRSLIGNAHDQFNVCAAALAEFSQKPLKPACPHGTKTNFAGVRVRDQTNVANQTPLEVEMRYIGCN